MAHTPEANDRVLAFACAAALATLVPVALYQTGVLSRLPDPPISIFDSDRITSSRAAHPLGVPDALIGLANFGATLMLIPLAGRSATAKKLLGAKLTVDAAAGAFNVVRQVVSFGKLCSWCIGTALATGVMVYAGRDAIQDSWSGVVVLAKSGMSNRQAT